jgi:GH35 family endo-1,4-beta-xylanase
MVTPSFVSKVGGWSSVVALCLCASPSFAQSAGGIGGAPSSGGAMSSGGAGNSGGADSAGGVPNSGAGGQSAGGQSGEGSSSGGAASGAAGLTSSAGSGGTAGYGGLTGAAGMNAAAGMTGAAGMSGLNLVSNGTFDTGTAPFWSHANSTTEFPSDVTLAVSNGQLCATMTTGGGQNYWDAIVGVSDLPLLPNQYYRLAFSVTADANRTIKFKTGLGVAPYTDYFIQSVSVTAVPVTATPQTIEYTYLNLRNDATAQFQFQIGGPAGIVCVDNVVLEPVAAPATPTYVTPAPSQHPFKSYAGTVKIGTAVDTQIFLSNPLHNAIAAGEFAMITPANAMKMNVIQPTQGVFDYAEADALAAWAQANNLEFHGHPLVWHTQTPSWLNDGVFDRDQMIAILYAHIDALMGRYVGKFPYWDVVNEAIEEVEDVWTFRPTVWHDRIGADFIDLAFVRARAADPSAKLLYNDYNIEQKGNQKADYVFDMVSSMKTRGIPIDAIGFQGHYYIQPDGSTTKGIPDIQAIRDNMARYAAIGVDVHITECDFRIGNPLDDAKLQIQSKFYADFLQACIDAPNCSHFTVWGVSDLDSWVPGTFADYDHAHLFDKSLMPKPGYVAMSQVLAQYSPDAPPAGVAGSPGMGAAGMAGMAAAMAGSPGMAAASPKPEENSGCSLTPRPSRGGASVAVLVLLGVLFSRRRSKATRAVAD